MITRALALVRDGTAYIRDNPQLLFTLLLIVVIPTAFLVSAEQFLSASRDNQERLEKDRIGLMHDVFASVIETADGDVRVIEREIHNIASLNPDITQFRVLQYVNGVAVPIAALDAETVSVPETAQDIYAFSRLRPDESLIFTAVIGGERHWQAVRSLELDTKTYFIYTETSLEHVDALFRERIVTAYYWLFGLLVVVLLLVLQHVRLIDYGRLYREVREANEMKDLFTNMIAHELRAPLTAVRGHLESAIETPKLPPAAKERLLHIDRATIQLLAIITDLLDVARLQSGKMEVKEEQYDISSVIRDVLSEQQAVALQHNVTLTQIGHQESLTTIGDEKRMHQVLVNLVSNAIKYTKEGAIEVDLSDTVSAVEIRVKDTGMGISAEDQQKLFAPFFRVARPDVSAITGTGLGMWIAKHLVERMRGTIAVESIKGVGTHIVVRLPKLK